MQANPNVKAFTLEIYHPCYPYNGPNICRVWMGDGNTTDRDRLSPDCVQWYVVRVRNRPAALKSARQYAKQFNAVMGS